MKPSKSDTKLAADHVLARHDLTYDELFDATQASIAMADHWITEEFTCHCTSYEPGKKSRRIMTNTVDLYLPDEEELEPWTELEANDPGTAWTCEALIPDPSDSERLHACGHYNQYCTWQCAVCGCGHQNRDQETSRRVLAALQTSKISETSLKQLVNQIRFQAGTQDFCLDLTGKALRKEADYQLLQTSGQDHAMPNLNAMALNPGSCNEGEEGAMAQDVFSSIENVHRHMQWRGRAKSRQPFAMRVDRRSADPEISDSSQTASQPMAQRHEDLEQPGLHPPNIEGNLQNAPATEPERAAALTAGQEHADLQYRTTDLEDGNQVTSCGALEKQLTFLAANLEPLLDLNLRKRKRESETSRHYASGFGFEADRPTPREGFISQGSIFDLLLPLVTENPRNKGIGSRASGISDIKARFLRRKEIERAAFFWHNTPPTRSLEEPFQSILHPALFAQKKVSRQSDVCQEPVAELRADAQKTQNKRQKTSSPEAGTQDSEIAIASEVAEPLSTPGEERQENTKPRQSSGAKKSRKRKTIDHRGMGLHPAGNPPSLEHRRRQEAVQDMFGPPMPLGPRLREAETIGDPSQAPETSATSAFSPWQGCQQEDPPTTQQHMSRISPFAGLEIFRWKDLARMRGNDALTSLEDDRRAWAKAYKCLPIGAASVLHDAARMGVSPEILKRAMLRLKQDN